LPDYNTGSTSTIIIQESIVVRLFISAIEVRLDMLRIFSREELLSKLRDQDSLNKKHSSSLSEKSTSSSSTMEQYFEYKEEESKNMVEDSHSSLKIPEIDNVHYHRTMSTDDRIKLADMKLAQERAARKLKQPDQTKPKRKSPAKSTPASKAVKSKSKTVEI